MAFYGEPYHIRVRTLGHIRLVNTPVSKTAERKLEEDGNDHLRLYKETLSSVENPAGVVDRLQKGHMALKNVSGSSRK
jgi:hypothetical protein